mmetsp:Transcript_37597/g.106192  ORF Transcript_37597/g.106192 Transcript_37597/m.106192 type:complete len:611 (-) Transcript_37597:156-1988(-)
MAKKKKHSKKNPRGTKKKDKIHGTKAGTKGESAAYITRAQALSKLQVSLADFRKLCILKGIYPRDPKKKKDGMDKTYYHSKDIKFLAHEPLLEKFFELKTFMKKWKRLMGRDEKDLAAGAVERKPTYTLHHVVRERYPSFDEALRDMDDAISMLALFQSLPASQGREIPTEAINEATRLYQEFQLYVIRAQALRKVFATIKGYYFQAEICGQMVTWLVPHQFAQQLPLEVDFRVMLTFLEFYRAMVKFVNYRLFTGLGLEYPPKRHAKRDARSAEVAALEVEMREAGKGREEQAQQNEQEDTQIATSVIADFGEQAEEAAEMQRQVVEASRMKATFRGVNAFINREVPLRPLYFTLLCGGVNKVGWERGSHSSSNHANGSAFTAKAKHITHQIVDRPPDQVETLPGREYVQPQWVFDSFNTGCALPIAPYMPGRAPPPHLSPFVDDKAEGYVPRQREILDKFAAETNARAAAAPAASGGGPETPAGAEAAGEAADAGAKPAEDTFDEFSKELHAESKGVWHSAFQKDAGAGGPEVSAADSPAQQAEGMAAKPPPPLPTEAEEERMRAKALMPKKHKRLLQRIEYTAQQKDNKKQRLLQKRQELEESAPAA